jgi:hypothetical protein
LAELWRASCGIYFGPAPNHTDGDFIVLLSMSRKAMVCTVVCLLFSAICAEDFEPRAMPQTEPLNGNELPASITDPSDLLPLATGGPYAFDPLPMCGDGCAPRPIIRCTGPAYRGCNPRLYYGTNPYDDDPILPLYPSINNRKTKHWYQHAFDLVKRKKAITAAIK